MRTWLTVDFEQIKKNLDVVKGVIPEKCEIIAVVKANAYGHGDVPVARKLMEFGIKRFAVACMSEALKLREAGIGEEMIILGYTPAEEALAAFDNNLTLACVSREHLEALSSAMEGKGEKLKVNLGINTGMNRIGFDCRTEEQLSDIADAYKAKNLDVCGIFSHFSSSDDLSDGADDYTKLQLSRYERVLEYLEAHGVEPGLRHISNSGAIGKYPQARFDAVRCGGLMYGYNTAFDAKLPVAPAMEWRAAVSCVRTIYDGDGVSYSRRFIAREPRRIATLCIGYADGYNRHLSCKGSVIINGQKVPVVGGICMDQMMVDITDVKTPVGMGSEAIIIGREGDAVITADDMAEAAGTCMHDILSCIGARVERYYK